MRLFKRPAAPVGKALERHLLDRLRIREPCAVAESRRCGDAVRIRPAGVEADIVRAMQVVAIAAVGAPFGADGKGIGIATVAKRTVSPELSAARMQRSEAGDELA